MSNLVELIQRLCPDGVKYNQLGEVAFYVSERIDAKNVTADSYIGVDNLLPGKKGKTISTCAPTGGRLIAFHSGDILVGNIRPYLKKIWRATCSGGTNGDVLTIRPNNQNEVSSEFLYYVLSSDRFFGYVMQNAKGAKMPRGDKASVLKYQLPIPPLKVQQEIVRILDQFTELTAELTTQLNAELTARKKQYAYYRDELLHEKSFSVVRECNLGDVADIHTGSKPDEIFEEHSEFEYINAGTTNSGYVKTSNCPGDTVTTPSRGQGGIGFIGYQSQSFHLGPLCYSIRSSNENIIMNKFIYYWLSSHKNDILAFKKEGGTPALNRGDLMGLRICIPHVSVQRQIVEILDRFDALCNDLTSGLPAEIEARQKQYEHYRDKLLTFKELGG